MSEDLIHIKRINSCSFLVYYITFAETHLYFNLTEIRQLEMWNVLQLKISLTHIAVY